MSIKAVSWALELFVPDMAAKLVLVALADHADSKTGDCFPTIETLSKSASASPRTVQRKIAMLVDWGLVERTENFSDGRQRANSYRLRLEVDCIAQDLAEGCQAVTPGEGVTPVTGEGVTPVTPEGATAVTPLKEPLEETVITNLAAAPLGVVCFQDLVEEYSPRSEHDAVDPARGVWKTLNPDDQAAAVTNARAFCKAAGANGKPVPYVAVYLKERRWQSIPAPSAAPIACEFVREGTPRWDELAKVRGASKMRSQLTNHRGQEVYVYYPQRNPA